MAGHAEPLRGKNRTQIPMPRARTAVPQRSPAGGFDSGHQGDIAALVQSMTAETATARPSISLIIPAYNEEAYLGACLDAVMANIAGKALEIIVVDNNSTDGTKAVAQLYPAVTYVFEPEKGITRARQRGFLTARGDILAYVDADTHPPDGWIEQIWEQFGKNSEGSG